MSQSLTAEELRPHSTGLSSKEHLHLLKLAADNSADAKTYQASPVYPEEFGSSDDRLSWDAEGWGGRGNLQAPSEVRDEA